LWKSVWRAGLLGASPARSRSKRKYFRRKYHKPTRFSQTDSERYEFTTFDFPFARFTRKMVNLSSSDDLGHGYYIAPSAFSKLAPFPCASPKNLQVSTVVQLFSFEIGAGILSLQRRCSASFCTLHFLCIRVLSIDIDFAVSTMGSPCIIFS